MATEDILQDLPPELRDQWLSFKKDKNPAEKPGDELDRELL